MAADMTAVSHILVTTNTAGIMAILTATATAWLLIGKPDLGMSINGLLAGLVMITPGCAFVSIPASMLLGAISGVLVVLAVVFFDKRKLDDPVGALAVHLVHGVLGTLSIGLFAKDGVAGISSANGLFYGGGFGLLGKQALGVAATALFVFPVSLLIWFLIKKTIGLRVSAKEEIEGLDIGEHGNEAYPDFSVLDYTSSPERFEGVDIPAITGNVPPETAIPVEVAPRVLVDRPSSGIKMTKIEIITKQGRFETLKAAMDKIGITGMTVTNVLGYGTQGGHVEYYRGAEYETNLLPKVKVEIVVSKVPVRMVIDTAKKVLYTGNVGDGKIFVYDVENVIKVRTGEEGFDALQDVE
jgi:Amt family ammonium transporter